MNCVYVCSCSSQPQIGLWWHDDKTREKISKGTFLFFFCPVTENKELLLLFSSVSRYRFPLQLLEEENIVQTRSCWPLSLVNLSRPVVLVVARWLNAAGPRTDPVFVRPIGRPKSYARWRVGGMGPRALGVEWLWISCFVIQVSRSRLNVPVHLLFFFFPIFIFIFFCIWDGVFQAGQLSWFNQPAIITRTDGPKYCVALVKTRMEFSGVSTHA